MYRTFKTVGMCASASILMLAIACSSSTPAGPGPSSPGGPTGAAPDGSTLKATAPTPLSPANNQRIEGVRPTFQIAGSTGRFVTLSFSYEFELLNASGASLRRQTVSGLTWAMTEDLPHDTVHGWRARAVLANASGTAVGPWSSTFGFRTAEFVLPGCINGRLTDPKAYFFFLINRKEGDSARDWHAVLSASGLPAGPTQGVRPGNAFFGLTQQIDSSGNLRGRIFLPTETPSPFGYFIQDVDVLSDPAGTTWVWRPHGGAPYVPRACP